MLASRSGLFKKRESFDNSGFPNSLQSLRKAGLFPAATKISTVFVLNLS